MNTDRTSRPPIFASSGAALLLGLAGAGCESVATSRAIPRTSAQAGSPSDSIPMLIDGRAVSWGEIRSRLGEASGAAVVEEIALDRLLPLELARRGLDAGDLDIGFEISEFERSVRSTGMGGANAGRLLEEVKRRRGLGPVRFAALVERNAMLRRLARDRVEVTDAELRLAFDIRYGVRHEVRVIVTETEREASGIRREVLGGGGDRTLEFARLATSRSIDPSGPAGGLLGAVSASDPALPEAFRAALRGLTPGALSAVIALEHGYALMLLERVIPASGATLATERDSIAEEIRRRKERIEMQRIAASLLDRASIGVLDPALSWSWESRTAG